MKLFDDFEAVRFSEEDLIFVTHNKYLYYIYNPKYKTWRKHRNAGNDCISVDNYKDISVEEITDAMGGVFPSKESDFMRLIHPSQLYIRDMFDLFREDYPSIINDWVIKDTAHHFLLESDICDRAYLELKKVFDNALANKWDNDQTLNQIKALSYRMIGRDIFKPEIGIVDGHNGSSYFWIMPVRVIDYSNTEDYNSVAEMRSAEISIEEDDVNQFLTPFLYKYFDNELEANKNRVEYYGDDEEDDGACYIAGFEWYLTHNYYTFDSVRDILKDIRDTVEALSCGQENEYTSKLKEKRGSGTYQLLYSRFLTEEQVKEYNDNRPTEDDTDVELILDFYNRFIYRMEYMIRVGEEKGYNLISFMGP